MGSLNKEIIKKRCFRLAGELKTGCLVAIAHQNLEFSQLFCLGKLFADSLSKWKSNYSKRLQNTLSLAEEPKPLHFLFVWIFFFVFFPIELPDKTDSPIKRTIPDFRLVCLIAAYHRRIRASSTWAKPHLNASHKFLWATVCSPSSKVSNRDYQQIIGHRLNAASATQEALVNAFHEAFPVARCTVCGNKFVRRMEN